MTSESLELESPPLPGKQPGWCSILYDRQEDRARVEGAEEPACFADLNLDQILSSMVAGRDEYDLKPFFYVPLHDVDSVAYRHEVLHDLEREEVFAAVKAFAEKMQDMRKHLAQVEELHYKYQKERWFLDAITIYCDAVCALAADLNRLDPTSRGFRGFREYLTHYTESNDFRSLVAETHKLQEDLAGVKYSIHIKGNRVKVSKYEGEADYSEDVLQTFERFKQGAVKEYLVKFHEFADMNHVEARILDLVAQLYPEVFLSLDEYCARHLNYLDRTLADFDREIQFCVAYLEYINRFKAAGLKFAYPEVSDRSKEVHAYQAFDLALANKLVPEGSSVVCNDFYLEGPERIFVVSGPNQGGKTTFARMFGQLHYLASLGYPVPGREAALFLPDQVFTHLEREEDLTTLRGKLEDELVRVHEILNQATSNSIIIMNESFTSTTLNDALVLGKAIMEQIIALGSLGIYVTFVDEFASLDESTVSMVSTVVPENPAERTFKIVRKPADGLAYAAAIAQKYGLTYEGLKKRVAG